MELLTRKYECGQTWDCDALLLLASHTWHGHSLRPKSCQFSAGILSLQKPSCKCHWGLLNLQEDYSSAYV